jgi:uncharacterized membrane protein YfcA
MRRSPYDKALVSLVIVLVAGMLIGITLVILLDLREPFMALISIVVVGSAFYISYRNRPKTPNQTKVNTRENPP